jgi:orotidine-5'-phosphate decarboxylase
MPHPADSLHDRIARMGNFACVGIDPALEHLPSPLRQEHTDPARAIEAFSIGVTDAVARTVPAVKFQSACYERFGHAGLRALEVSIRHAADAGLAVVLDVKRGDIGISAAHYAAACARTGAHFVTLSGYMGPSTIEPFLDAGLGVFVLVRTSNPDSDAIQSLRLEDGRSVDEAMADMTNALGEPRCGRCGISAVGAVVGATQSAHAAALRARMPDQFFLVPGFGAQGGRPEDIRAMLRKHAQSPQDAGVLVTASRSVIYPPASSVDWRDSIASAAKALVEQLQPCASGRWPV